MKPRMQIILYRIAAVLFALTSGVNAFSAYRGHQKGDPIGFYAALAVTYLAVCVVFGALGWLKSRTEK